MKRLLMVFLLLLALPACASFKEAWQENSSSPPEGSMANGDIKFMVGGQEKTSSEERTDRYESREDGLMKDLNIGISNRWEF